MSEVITSELEAMEKQKSEQLEAIERRKLALRLFSNPDFKKLILEEFCVIEAARYAQTAGHPALSKIQRKDAMNMALASGHLKRFLSMCVQAGAHAERELDATDDALAEMRADEAGS